MVEIVLAAVNGTMVDPPDPLPAESVVTVAIVFPSGEPYNPEPVLPKTAPVGSLLPDPEELQGSATLWV